MSSLLVPQLSSGEEPLGKKMTFRIGWPTSWGLLVLIIGSSPALSLADSDGLPQETSAENGVAESRIDSERTASDGYVTESVRGRVVWLYEALKEDFGISTVVEAKERVLALRSSTGEILPIVENKRGRSFRKDERLRQMDLELTIRRYQKHPLIQILKVFEVVDGRKFEVDYWCDVCAIPMYETGPCDCCQDHNRLRKREVADEDG